MADPPLSMEGSLRAAELAAYFHANGGLDQIFVSPYLRSLQIAQHLAWATKKKLLVEPGLSNVPHTNTKIPRAQECFVFCPSVDLRHTPSSRDPHPDETILSSLPRVLDAGLDISMRMVPGQKVAIVTHAVTGQMRRGFFLTAFACRVACVGVYCILSS